MGRQKGSVPLGGPSKQIAISVTIEQYNAITALAVPNDQSVATWIRRAIAQRLERDTPL